MLALLAALTSTVAAQVPPKVFHVYVDPIFGDDGQAFANNPDADPNTTRPAPFAQHPDAAQFLNDVPQGTIRHAPYSFRTLTGPQGVAAYLNSLDLYLQGETALAMIHCLPGIYGPATGPGYPDPIDHRSGLPFNGENWPFTLRWYWSLQGTSALDTVFDARSGQSTIITVQADSFHQLSHVDSIIDSITVRGARSGSTYTPTVATGAGILITPQPLVGTQRGTQIRVTISNCFIVDNHVGIAIDNSAPDAHDTNFPFIIGNTFARNWIGLWNGNRGTTLGEINAGWATPVLINNIFDSWRPDVPATQTTPFVGVAWHYITVSELQYTTGGFTPLLPMRSFCAWEAGRDNAPAGLPNWPAPTVPASRAGPLPPPRVDILPFTGTATGSTRGTLFINDLLRNAGLAGPFEYSANDYRLAPSVSTDASPPPTFPAGRNPLVNQGIYIKVMNGIDSGLRGIRMATYTLLGGPACEIVYPPGPPSEAFATLHAWDWDCEGFGNPRVVIRDDFPFTGSYFQGDTPIDLGADEMDDLIIAGYIEGTRILSSYVPGAPTVWDHRRLFFVNVADPLRTWTRPRYVQVDGQAYQWWSHVQGAPDAGGGTNYTAGVVNSRRTALRVTGGKPLFMRNLQCDFSPHLLADPHPMWPQGFPPQPTEVPDIYAANPWWWQATPQGGQPFTHDNAALYDNWDTSSWQPHGFNNVIAQPPFGMPRTAVLCGVLNPPMTGLFPSGPGMWYLNPPTPQPPIFKSVAPCQGGGVSTYTVGARGLGDAGANCPELVPVAPGFLGRRFDFQAERAKGAYTNLQTLLSVDGLPPILEGVAGQGPSPETARQHGRMVEGRLRRW